jgi:hypothetical protein
MQCVNGELHGRGGYRHAVGWGLQEPHWRRLGQLQGGVLEGLQLRWGCVLSNRAVLLDEDVAVAQPRVPHGEAPWR